jgi:hypothetical protein
MKNKSCIIIALLVALLSGCAYPVAVKRPAPKLPPMPPATRARMAALTLAAVGQTTNVNMTVEGPLDIINEDGTTNQTQVLYICGTTQLASNEVCIKSSANLNFTFAIEANWSCYPSEQPVGLFAIEEKTTPRKFFESINTPCTYTPPALSLAAAAPAVTTLRYVDSRGIRRTLAASPRFKMIGKLKGKR